EREDEARQGRSQRQTRTARRETPYVSGLWPPARGQGQSLPPARRHVKRRRRNRPVRPDIIEFEPRADGPARTAERPDRPEWPERARRLRGPVLVIEPAGTNGPQRRPGFRLARPRLRGEGRVRAEPGAPPRDRS